MQHECLSLGKFYYSYHIILCLIFFFRNNIENMRKNKPTFSTTSPNLNNSFNIKSMLSPTSKKVEGFDKTTSSQMFNSKVNKLKNKPKVEGLEDQYISGLQDEIKYLQMQLKLLQEKDQQRHGQIDQLEKFFGDGIPINQNILAIKNGFNNYKNSNEKKIKELVSQKQQRSTLINSLSQRVEALLDEANNHEKDKRKCTQNQQTEWFKLIYQQASLKRSLEREEDDLKTVKQENRKLFEKIEKVTRNKLIDNITIIKHENNKFNKLNELKVAVSERESELLELRKQYNELLKEEQQKGYLIRLQEQNLNQRKKIISFQRELDNLKSKIKEKAMELEEKLKERMSEIHCKMDIKGKVDSLKEEINRQNSITVELVADIARDEEIERLNRIVDNNKKLAKYTDHYSSVLANLENSIEALAQRKPEARSQIQAYSIELTKLTHREASQREREVSIHSETVQLQEEFNESKGLITPLQERTRKNNEQIQAYLEERRRLMEEIKIKEKQLELIFILKGLNFDQAQISKSTNSSIQEELTNFLKSWEKIQRNS